MQGVEDVTPILLLYRHSCVMDGSGLAFEPQALSRRIKRGAMTTRSLGRSGLFRRALNRFAAVDPISRGIVPMVVREG